MLFHESDSVITLLIRIGLPRIPLLLEDLVDQLLNDDFDVFVGGGAVEDAGLDQLVYALPDQLVSHPVDELVVLA